MLRSGLIIFIYGLFFGVLSFAQGQAVADASIKKEDRRFTADWRVKLYGVDRSNIDSQAKYVDFKLDLRSNYRLTSNLYLDIKPTFRLQAGQTQSVDAADKTENKILLQQAAVHYKPFQEWTLSAGALNQEPIHTRIFIDEYAFPAARLGTLFKVADWKTGFTLESAIPTSTSLSTNTNELEPTPSLNSASLFLNWGSRKNFQWNNFVSYFAYNNLPSAVAKDSNLLGNEVEQVTAADYRFLYQFQGIEASTELVFPVSRTLDLNLGGEYLQNQKAPSDVNTGYRLVAGADVHINKDYDFSGKAHFFSIAPEATVSYFNFKNFETNRVGFGAEGFLSFLNEGFKVGLYYSDAEVMYKDVNQSRQKSIVVKLETFYADI